MQFRMNNGPPGIPLKGFKAKKFKQIFIGLCGLAGIPVDWSVWEEFTQADIHEDIYKPIIEMALVILRTYQENYHG